MFFFFRVSEVKHLSSFHFPFSNELVLKRVKSNGWPIQRTRLLFAAKSDMEEVCEQ